MSRYRRASMYLFAAIACAAWAAHAASTVTLQVIGEKGVLAHQDHSLLFLKAPVHVRVCLVFGWTYNVQSYVHTSRCTVATPDCRCYVWKHATSGTQCVDILLSDTVTLTWYLLPQFNVSAIPSTGILQYSILRNRWLQYTVADFATTFCRNADHQHRPPNYVVTHTIPIEVVTPTTVVPDTSTVTSLLVVGYIFAMLVAAVIHNSV